MRVLLTGATGFIGAHLLERLVGNSFDVTALVLPETLKELSHKNRINVVVGSLNDKRALEQATKQIEVVFHLAGQIWGGPSSHLTSVNVHGTQSLLAACIAHRVRRFVFVSSAAVYRPPRSMRDFPLTEAARLGPADNSPFRDYGNTKIHAERLVLQRHQSHGIEYCILRPTTAYGACGGPSAEYLKLFLHKLLESLYSSLPAEQLSLPMQWVHVRDLANAIFRAGIVPGARNQIFNIAGAETFDLESLTRTMLEILRPRAATGWVEALSASRPAKDHPEVIFDTRKAQEVLSFRPSINLRTGLLQMLAVMRRKGRLPLCLPKAGVPRVVRNFETFAGAYPH